MLVKATETVIAEAIKIALNNAEPDHGNIKWTEDRHGLKRATLSAYWQGMSLLVIVEEVDSCEWTAWLDGRLPTLSYCSNESRIESPEDCMDMISLLRRGRALLTQVQYEMELAAINAVTGR